MRVILLMGALLTFLMGLMSRKPPRLMPSPAGSQRMLLSFFPIKSRLLTSASSTTASATRSC